MQPAPDLLKLLPILRLAMTAMVVFVGGVSWYLVDSEQLKPIFPADHPAMVGYFGVVTLVMVGAILYFKRKREATKSRARYASFTLIGWSAAEGIAVMGAIFYLVTGNPTYYLAGFLLLLSAFLMVPAGDGTGTDVLS
ncbi:MAG: hypothetical protein R2834_22080 [Rhodothermales bacterium]